MSDQPPVATVTFAGIAKRVQHRLVVRKALLHLLKTWPYAAAMVGLIVAARLLGASFATSALALSLLLLWTAGCFVQAYRRLPVQYAAFSFWDHAVGRSDDFANAWWFESLESRTPGQLLHIERNLKQLPSAAAQLKKDVPLPDVRRLVALPLVALLIALLPRAGGALLPDAELSSEARKTADAEARKIAETKIDAEKMKGLSEDEKKEVEKLRNKIQDTAKSLQEDGAKTARQVLGDLERRAREAERMASKLGAGDAAWASEQMIAEMRKHVDTAELGDAAASRNAQSTGSRAQELAEKLKDPKLANEVRDRMSETLRDISKQAQPEDKERTVGQHVLGAEKNLAQSLPKEAGQEFQQLADKMRSLAQREKAREELEKVAQQLRDSAGNIAGQGSQGMQQLAGTQDRQQSQQGQQGQGQQQMMTMQNAQQAQPMQMPGMSQGAQGQSQQGNAQQMQAFTPSPNNGKGQQIAEAPPDGKSDGKNDRNDQPKLFAPIPGMPQGKPDAVIVMPGASSGNQAGNGVAKMDGKATQQNKATQQGVVNAQRNADGASAVRSIDGQARNEQATRNTQAAAISAIAAEENALDDSALPPARREQVRRYFNELRKRFEKSN